MCHKGYFCHLFVQTWRGVVFDIQQELEALKAELEDSQDTTNAVQEVRSKREEEVKALKESLDQAQKRHEAQITDLRSKHQQQMEALNVELENVRKVIHCWKE